MLDDNGDGTGHHQFLFGETEGNRSRTMFVGTGFKTALADIHGVTATLYLGEEKSTADLLAVSDADSLANAWVEIRSPLTRSETDIGYAHQPLVMPVQSMKHDPTTRMWKTTWKGFNTSGKYEILYFIRNPGENTQFSMNRSIVYKNRPGNLPPDEFHLLAPANGAEQTTMPVFDWDETQDPDYDAITYNLVVATDLNFHNILIRQEEIGHPPFRIEDPFILKDLTHYYWMIEAVDSFGSIRTSSEIRQFHTDNTNGFQSYITGRVMDSSDLTGITGAGIKYDQTQIQ